MVEDGTMKALLKKYSRLVGKMLYDYLDDKKSKVLLVIDGMDEFRFIDDLINISSTQCENVAYQIHGLIKSLYGNQQNKVLLTGRPYIMEALHQTYRVQVNCKLIEIVGFHDESVMIFIEKFFVDDQEKCKSMKNKVLELHHIKSMARIPVA